MSSGPLPNPASPRLRMASCGLDCPHADEMCQAQKLGSLGLMVGEVAHDLNNLLAVILGHAELAMDETREGQDVSARLGDVRDAVADAAALCRGLLACAGKAEPVRTAISLPDLVAQLERILRVSVPRHSRFECSVPADLPRLVGDPSQLRQILMNLIFNALESLGDRPGCVRMEVEHVRKSEGEGIGIRVSDTGCGMDGEVLSKLFRPFFSTKAKGRGLGLAAVRSLTEGLNGTIEASSEPGRGTCFDLYFPLGAAEAEGASAGGASGEESVDEATWSGSGTVLLVDDEPDLRILGAAMLEKIGLRVLTARDGGEAIDCLGRYGEKIDLVFMDAMMPRMDGCEALGRIRQLAPGVPVVMVSGHAESDLRRLWNDYRPDEVLLKPVSATKLRQVAIRCLASAAAAGNCVPTGMGATEE
jgi:two-component system, cell cycle sensor histidine kinase and response regulator CckA